jgi:GTP-binding protein
MSSSGGKRKIAPGAEVRRIAAESVPAIVLVGRANAGKSTLFNRIARGNKAITSSVAGTTRDLNFARANHEGREFTLIDSGGLELGGTEPLSDRIVAEALGAIGAADVVVFVLDGRAGLTQADAEAVALVRETGCPLILAVNKIDSDQSGGALSEYHALGIDPIFAISAAHGRGVNALLDEIATRIPSRDAAETTAPDLRVALVGRPNVGKSSILNCLSGFERAIVSDVPGTTRDPVDVRVRVGEREVLLIDTAGIRRPARVEGELEQHSVGRAIETIRRADVVVVVIDASEGVTDQETRLARLIDSNDRAIVLVCNKWDLAAKMGRRTAIFARDLRERYAFLTHAAVVFTSAATGDGIGDILPAASRAGEAWRSSFQTSVLNKILAEALAAMDPPMVGRRRLNLMYVTQTASAPPKLTFFANIETEIPPHYVRFLGSRFREALGLVGTPLRIVFRRTGRTKNPNRPARRSEHRGMRRQ